MVSNGWDIRTVPQMAGTSYYINAADNTAEVIPMSVGGSAPGNVPAATGGNNDGGSGASSTPAASATTTTTTTSNNNAANSASSLLGVSRSFIVGLVASVLCAQRLFS
ncbi:hypothetical protein FRC03_008325 [Tulasnella sp. 419]|nr:hypothetical protein FRC03_008325 [Tulasnella sp. 419]